MGSKGINKFIPLVGAMIAAIGLPASATEIVVHNADGEPMSGMVVYLQADAANQASKVDTIREPIEIHQYNKQFTPYITVIQKGYQLQFINDDDITHHIYSASGPKRFSFKLKKDNAQKQMLFDETGHISMGCNIHDWMSGHVLVVDTPHFGVTDEQGTVNLEQVADGHYQVIIWHPQLLSQDNIATSVGQWPLSQAMTISVAAPMADIPTQQSLDDFEFLEGY